MPSPQIPAYLKRLLGRFLVSPIVAGYLHSDVGLPRVLLQIEAGLAGHDKASAAGS